MPWQPNKEADDNSFSYYKLYLHKQHFTKLEAYCFSGFGVVGIQRIPFFRNLMLPWQPNKMITGHKTHKLGRQSSNDHKITAKYIHITALVMEKMLINHFPIMSMGAFCCHGNQTNWKISIILAIFIQIHLLKQHSNLF